MGGEVAPVWIPLAAAGLGALLGGTLALVGGFYARRAETRREQRAEILKVHLREFYWLTDDLSRLADASAAVRTLGRHAIVCSRRDSAYVDPIIWWIDETKRRVDASDFEGAKEARLRVVEGGNEYLLFLGDYFQRRLVVRALLRVRGKRRPISGGNELHPDLRGEGLPTA